MFPLPSSSLRFFKPVPLNPAGGFLLGGYENFATPTPTGINVSVSRCLSHLINLQLSELLDDVGSVVAEFDIFINRKDFTVFADVKGPTFGKAAEAYGIFFYQTVSDGGFAGGVTQDWVIKLQGLCKFLVGFLLVAARGEVGELIGFDFFADLTERHAFGFSSAGEGLGEPGYDDGFFADEIRQLVDDSIAAHEFKIRSDVAYLWCL